MHVEFTPEQRKTGSVWKEKGTGGEPLGKLAS